jgi:hypothetical protein
VLLGLLVAVHISSPEARSRSQALSPTRIATGESRMSNNQMTLEAESKSDAIALRTPAQLIELAVQKGADADQLGKLMELQLRWQANEARLAYVAALQAFKKSAPEILKTRKVRYENKDHTFTEYSHAELDKIVECLTPALSAVGIIATWRHGDSNGRILVTCVLTHALGHSEDVATLSGPADTSGGKNSIQAIGSTAHYLERYTFLGGLGLAAKGIDDDGRKGEGLSDEAVRDYLLTMQDATNMDELREMFAAAYKTAKGMGDKASMKAFIDAKDSRRKEISQ